MPLARAQRRHYGLIAISRGFENAAVGAWSGIVGQSQEPLPSRDDARATRTLGHVTVVTGGRDCHCPNQGCLEAYAGGWAIAERAQEAVRADPQGGNRLMDEAGSVEEISAATVAKACIAGDPLAHRLIEQTARYLAAGLVSLVNAFGPCLLVLGGGVIQGLPDVVPMVEGPVRAKALGAAVEGLRIVSAGLGRKEGIVGAVALARQAIGQRV